MMQILYIKESIFKHWNDAYKKTQERKINNKTIIYPSNCNDLARIGTSDSGTSQLSKRHKEC